MQNTFVITIEGQKAHTWQGTITHQAENYHFNSELELLLSIQRLLEKDVSQTQFNEEKENVL